MFEKIFNVPGVHTGEARTLPVSAVSDDKPYEGEHTKTHADGWTITGAVHDDYYTWVNEFTATHPIYGKVWGDFETVVHADSEEGYDNFVKHHPPETWDYGDI